MRFGYAFCARLSRWILSFLFGLKVRGSEYIPLRGKLIVAANHRSNLDPMILGAALPREIHFFAKTELFKNRLFAALIRYLNAFPVTRSGFDREALRHSMKTLESDEALLMFPEGTRAPAGGFLRVKTGIGWLAYSSRAQIVPVYVHGSDRALHAFFRRPRLVAVIGKPVSLADLVPHDTRGKELYRRIAEEILERIRTLSLETPGRLVKQKGPIYERDVIPYPELR
jgi:1-acyl-sn-glycerol-3-phosphate acyltransferase